MTKWTRTSADVAVAVKALVEVCPLPTLDVTAFTAEGSRA